MLCQRTESQLKPAQREGVHYSITLGRVKCSIPRTPFTTTTLPHVCTERYSYSEHVVKKTNTYRDMCVMWTCIHFTVFWRKNACCRTLRFSTPLCSLCWSAGRLLLCWITSCSCPPATGWGMWEEGRINKGVSFGPAWGIGEASSQWAKALLPTGAQFPHHWGQSLTALPHFSLFLPEPWLLPQQELGVLKHFYLRVFVCRWMSLWPHWCSGHLRPQRAVLSRQGAARRMLGWDLMNKLSTFLSHLGLLLLCCINVGLWRENWLLP